MSISEVRTKEGNPMRNWLKEKDLWGNKSFDKKIPQWFMEKSDEQSVCELLQGLWETDGTIIIGKKRYIKYSTTSKILAEQIIYLLAKIGIIAHLQDGYKSAKAKHFLYEVIIHSFHEINIFKQKIKLRGEKGRKIKLLTATYHPSHHSNILGRATTERLFKENDSKFRIQTHGNRRLTQQSLREVLKTASEEFIVKNGWLASEHIFWDRVESIEMIGEVDIFDRSVPNTHNFVVNGIIVHNSGSLEQDADVVIFMNKSDTPGFIDFSIAKNRNGKTDEFQLAVDFNIQKFFHRDSWIAYNPERNFIPPQLRAGEVEDLEF
jgi:replicative DNA helicase